MQARGRRLGHPARHPEPARWHALLHGHGGPKQAGIVLRASLAPDAKIVYWFADDRFIGASDAGGSVVWQPEPGSHRVSAVDDLGRRSHRTVTVRQP